MLTPFAATDSAPGFPGSLSSSWGAPAPWGEEVGARRCAVVMPIVKTAVGARGGLIHEGIASSEKRDIMGEILKATLGPKNLLAYMERCAGVDWNHTAPLIGKCLKARWQMDAAAICKSLGQEMEGIVPPAIWVQNIIHPLPARLDMATPGQKECYRLAEAGHPLFMSVYGKGIPGGHGTNALGESGKIVVPLFLNRIATTPEPANMDGYGKISIAKSLGEWQRELDEGDHTARNGAPRTSDELPPLVYFAPGVLDSLTDSMRAVSNALEVSKALEATGAVPSEGTGGGDAIKTVGVMGEKRTARKRTCGHCKEECDPRGRYCSSCGRALFNSNEAVETLSKALLPPMEDTRPRAVLR